MGKKKNIVFIGLILVILGIVAFFVLNKKSNDNNSNDPCQNIKAENASGYDIILFYGSTCPHCKNVDKFLEDEKICEKIKVGKMEVFGNKKNFDFMGEKAKECGLDTKELGVPLLWNKGKCYSGDEEVVNFFKN